MVEDGFIKGITGAGEAGLVGNEEVHGELLAETASHDQGYLVDHS